MAGAPQALSLIHIFVIAIIMLISAFTVTKLRKVIVLFCGLALLVNMAVMLAFMGWFIGTDMVLASALMILCGGLLFQPVERAATLEDIRAEVLTPDRLNSLVFGVFAIVALATPAASQISPKSASGKLDIPAAGSPVSADG